MKEGIHGGGMYTQNPRPAATLYDVKDNERWSLADWSPAQAGEQAVREREIAAASKANENGGAREAVADSIEGVIAEHETLAPEVVDELVESTRKGLRNHI